MRHLIILVCSFVITTSSISVNHLLTEETGFCEPSRWYGISPCQQCYCEKRNNLVCNTIDNGDRTQIMVGSQKLTLCRTNLKDDTDRLLSGLGKSNVLRIGDKSSDAESVEPHKVPEKVNKPKEIIAKPDSDSDSSEQSDGRVRMPLSYPNVGEGPKYVAESDSDDRADSEASNESNADARKYQVLRKDDDAGSKPLLINMKMKRQKTENDNIDLDLSLPTKLAELLAGQKMSLGNLGNLQRRASLSINTNKDFVVAYVHL